MTRSSILRLPRQPRSAPTTVSGVMRRALAMAMLVLVLGTYAVHGQDRSRYREFQLGSTLLAVAAAAHVPATEAKTIHQRPALLQELEWRPPFSMRGPALPKTDPVRQIVFSFYDDQLSRIVVDYDPEKTAGMTDADMIEAIATAYGPPLAPPSTKPRAGAGRLEDGSGTPIARWGDAEFGVVLYQSPYTSGFRIAVTSPRLEALARTAVAQAIRLDKGEAPQRELARQQKEQEATRLSQEKARLANKAAFKP